MITIVANDIENLNFFSARFWAVGCYNFSTKHHRKKIFPDLLKIKTFAVKLLY